MVIPPHQGWDFAIYAMKGTFMALFTKDEKLSFSVPEMHCAHCEMNVNALLRDFPGVKSVKPDAKTSMVEVTLAAKGSADPKDIAETLAAGGYPAKLV